MLNVRGIFAHLLLFVTEYCASLLSRNRSWNTLSVLPHLKLQYATSAWESKSIHSDPPSHPSCFPASLCHTLLSSSGSCYCELCSETFYGISLHCWQCCSMSLYHKTACQHHFVLVVWLNAKHGCLLYSISVATLVSIFWRLLSLLSE